MNSNWILILLSFLPVLSGLQIMKRRHTPSSKMGKTTGGKSAKKALKSQNQPGPSSKKKGRDGEGRKQVQKIKVIVILDQTS